MLASQLVENILKLIACEGDKTIAVAGVFQGGIHADIDVFSPTAYFAAADVP